MDKLSSLLSLISLSFLFTLVGNFDRIWVLKGEGTETIISEHRYYILRLVIRPEVRFWLSLISTALNGVTRKYESIGSTAR